MDQNIPEQIKEFAQSPEIFTACEAVGKIFGLHIDQIGELDSEVRSVLLGVHKGSDFTKHLVERLEIPNDQASKITAEVNKSIFETMKKNLKVSPSVPESITSVEKAGDFNIEPSLASSSADGKEIETPSVHEITAKDRNDILSGIEDPTPSPIIETHSEPLVDHLLSNPTSQTEQKIAQEPSVEPSPTPTNGPATPKSSAPIVPKPAPTQTRPAPAPRTGPDPYRESIN